MQSELIEKDKTENYRYLNWKTKIRAWDIYTKMILPYFLQKKNQVFYIIQQILNYIRYN